VAEAIELARTLQDLPRSLLVYAIEGEAFVVGTPLSQAVEGAIPEVIAQIRRDLARFAGP
jgi:hydrogenase maturation protease